MKRRVLLIGAYGQRNIGDDALLEVFLRQFPGDRVVVNSAEPEVTAERYGVEAVPTQLRLPRFQRPRHFLRADLVVFGGGSLLKEIEGNTRQRLMYSTRILGILAFCRLTNCRTAMIGVGAGPLDIRWNRWLAKVSANLTDLITVRDPRSRDLLRGIGTKTEVHVTADTVFTLAPSEMPARRETGAPPKVAVIPRYSLTTDERRQMAAACDRLVEEHGAQIRLITFQTGFRPEFDDDAASREIQSMMRYGDQAETWVPERVEETMDDLAQADLVLSARLHGLIFAAMQGAATIAVGYDPKVQAFMAELGREHACLSLDELRAGNLIDVIDREWPVREESGRNTFACVSRLKEEALRNFALLAQAATKWDAAPARKRMPKAASLVAFALPAAALAELLLR